MNSRWDIFCRVVDNYGDIGVTWRLARQLVAEHGLAVRLWVDDIDAFARLCPAADATATRQWRQGVEVCQWLDPWQPVAAADVVIEAFACELPADYLVAMRGRTPPLWLNLEYLSAEPWVEGCHGLPSLQSQGLQKFFFFPGFSDATGGLLRERSLLERRQAVQADDAARASLFRELGVQWSPAQRVISLFAYENSALASWLACLAAEATPTLLLVPQGRILGDLRQALGSGALESGVPFMIGHLQVEVLPFLEQDHYDRLLWCCDFNAVRGEDSFLRALWSGRPLLWQIYPQQEDAHWDKLEAFLARYLEGLPSAAAQPIKALWQAWNAGAAMGPAWTAFSEQWPRWQAHAQGWAQRQAVQADLATQLLDFYRHWSA